MAFRMNGQLQQPKPFVMPVAVLMNLNDPNSLAVFQYSIVPMVIYDKERRAVMISMDFLNEGNRPILGATIRQQIATKVMLPCNIVVDQKMNDGSLVRVSEHCWDATKVERLREANEMVDRLKMFVATLLASVDRRPDGEHSNPFRKLSLPQGHAFLPPTLLQNQVPGASGVHPLLHHQSVLVSPMFAAPPVQPPTGFLTAQTVAVPASSQFNLGCHPTDAATNEPMNQQTSAVTSPSASDMEKLAKILGTPSAM